MTRKPRLHHIAALTAALGLPAGPSPAATTDPTITLTLNGTQHSFVLHIPPNYSPNTAYPLMLVASGYNSSGASIDTTTNFDPIADANGFIVAYPNQSGAAWVLTGPDSDIAVSDAIVDWASTNYTIDPAKIYYVGYADGGRLALSYACNQSAGTYVAGIAIVANDMNAIDQAACNATTMPPTSFVIFHGTADNSSPYQGGPAGTGTLNLSSTETATYFQTFAACNPTPTLTNIPDELNNGQNITDTLQAWSNCTNNTVVDFYTIPGGGHTWPGSRATIGVIGQNGPVSLHLPASQLIWQTLSPFSAPNSRQN